MELGDQQHGRLLRRIGGPRAATRARALCGAMRSCCGSRDVLALCLLWPWGCSVCSSLSDQTGSAVHHMHLFPISTKKYKIKKLSKLSSALPMGGSNCASKTRALGLSSCSSGGFWSHTGPHHLGSTAAGLALTLMASQADPTALGPAEQQLHGRLFPCPHQQGELQDEDPRGVILQPVASSCLGSSRKKHPDGSPLPQFRQIFP